MRTFATILSLVTISLLLGTTTSSVADEVDSFAFYVRPKADQSDRVLLSSYEYFSDGVKLQWPELLKKVEKAAAESSSPVKVSVILSYQCPFSVMYDLRGIFGKIGGIQERFFLGEENRASGREFTIQLAPTGVILPERVLPPARKK